MHTPTNPSNRKIAILLVGLTALFAAALATPRPSATRLGETTLIGGVPATRYAQIRLTDPSPEDLAALAGRFGLEMLHLRDDIWLLWLQTEQMPEFTAKWSHLAWALETDDIGAFYAARLTNPEYDEINRAEAREAHGKTRIDSPSARQTIDNDWMLKGSMGGYLTYDEILEELDSFYAKYKDVPMTKPESIGTTEEGRDIMAFCMGDLKSENQVLYNGMHHAREGMSMMTVMYLAKNYGDNYKKDLEADYLTRGRKVCFVPIVNPDGYEKNRATNPNAGGMHRKNTHLVAECAASGNDGVDLNRNYADHFAADDVGSSPVCSQDTYRGPSAFSETETTALKDYVEAGSFKTCFSVHGFGAYLIHPESWSSVANQLPPGDFGQAHAEYAAKMVRFNGYSPGNAMTTVSYTGNGASDDWLASATNCISYTPEVGSNPGNAVAGFWPSQQRMLPIAEENLYMSLELAFQGGPYYEPQDLTVTAGAVEFTLKNTGWAASDGPVTVKIVPTNGFTVDGSDSESVGPLGPRESASGKTSFKLTGDAGSFNLVSSDKSTKHAFDFTYSVGIPSAGAEPVTCVCYHGSCIGQDECSCDSGWEGDRCQACAGGKECIKRDGGLLDFLGDAAPFILAALAIVVVGGAATGAILYRKKAIASAAASLDGPGMSPASDYGKSDGMTQASKATRPSSKSSKTRRSRSSKNKSRGSGKSGGGSGGRHRGRSRNSSSGMTQASGFTRKPRRN